MSSFASGVDREQPRLRGRPKKLDNSTSDYQPEENSTAKLEATKGFGSTSRTDGSLFNDLAKFESFVAPVVFTLLSLFTRLYQIGKADQVVWDEAHFGKFGGYYIRGEYYFDVHPPLGKLLVGLSEYIAGFNGTFQFESGVKYPDYVDYTKMRIFNAMFNVGCVPLAYYTAKALKLRLPTVWLVTLMMLLEHSYITLGKFILLDSMLCFFTFATVNSWIHFHNSQSKPFSSKWWFWLFMTGLSIGCVTSVKMVGLFVTALVGVYTIGDLWLKFGDTSMPVLTYLKHWAARIVCLIVLPCLVFMAAFKVHFMLLYKSGPGDANMSSLFQANLFNSSIVTGPMDVHYGSIVTWKNMGFNGGLLHSHQQTYPTGSEQQQVTTYTHKDYNNEWIIQRKRFDPNYEPEDPLEPLKNGDVVRFLHMGTGRNLHTHPIKAPLTKTKYEVSCYGNLTIGDEKDNWIVEIVESLGDEDKNIVHPLSTAVRFKSAAVGCYLTGEGNTLPHWGFRQGEVTCDPKASYRDKRTWWNVEYHANERLNQTVERKLPKTKFLRDFVQVNFAMMATNNALLPDPDKIDELASSAWEWPTLHVGLRMCGWGKENVRYFLLGHPTNTWLSSVGIIAFGVMVLVYILRWQRQIVDFDAQTFEHFVIAGVMPAIGWFLQFFPYVIMARVTYVHHYLPSLYFAILTFAFLIDYSTGKWLRNKYLSGAIYLTLYAVTIAIFIHFWPISFGMTGPVKDYEYLNWLKTWRIA